MIKRLGLVGVSVLVCSLVLGVGSVAAADSVTVQLSPQNGTSETGTATLTAVGDQTQVVVSITGAPAGVPEPEHIHTGSCATLGGVKYPLSNLVDGKSTTTVNAKLADLTTGGYAINLHKSAQEISTYVACGDIKAAAAATTPATAPATGSGGSASGSPWAAMVFVALGAAVAGGIGLRKGALRGK